MTRESGQGRRVRARDTPTTTQHHVTNDVIISDVMGHFETHQEAEGGIGQCRKLRVCRYSLISTRLHTRSLEDQPALRSAVHASPSHKATPTSM